MFRYKTVISLCFVWQVSWCVDHNFPPNFKFGAATSSYQIEGGWDADGKGVNVWDKVVHSNPEMFCGNATGDIAADSYHKWREDVRIAAELGLQFYRFSINWVRILPTGFSNEINKAGVKYYSDLIDALLAEGIEPIVTLYHWELPAIIQDLGGWTNPLIVDWFGDYARVVYSLYADRVNTWITINEVIVICDYGYYSGIFAPNIKEPLLAPYLCNKHTMLAHAKAYRIYDTEFRPKYNGRVSIANHLIWIEPHSAKDEELATLGREYMVGRFTHAIFSKNGGWPPSIEKMMLKNSLAQGFNSFRVLAFTDEEREFVKGTADFFAMNQYTTYTIRPAKKGEVTEYVFLKALPDLNAVLEPPPHAHYGESKMMPIYPEGIRRQMVWLKKQYGDIDILITENGYSSTGQLDDYDRIDFLKKYLEQILMAIKVDKVNVVGYTVWSLIDNFEWLQGYTSKFGLYEVDFENPDKKRTPRASAHFYACVIKNRSLNDTCLNYDFGYKV
ncbi:myrosinase 1-like [Nymphalis io]|uniref:myrosinase 1-like n=1 Tax=Inachis io TaxID=171585 RepID=UPI0021682174|nr:myrosinase 1-like [Nymphalis io]